ncbi:tRNA (adenosine(37)-N6)-dimethylallyltransferase MiaA [Flaviflexus massiliensis]|uniref:tRNA (adenosine(37)-N6)-dimethylallyltransferase MiaA n=1 Tax=Flaviflexus massiliensis TaxID=1522309 RepID=UPI0006D5A478|nr:tRNA (adenosine(37)-N6)-dimethylallyltransferase MiaA [Flaviflexus massiliensis]
MIIAIVGPTAVGKSAAAIELAERLGGPEAVEIIGADSMQLYRGMDIGTAKVTEVEQRGIAHHQIDVLDISQEASVSAYQKHARRDIDGIVDLGKVPILVGGSGLYVAAALDKIDFPGTIPEVRERYEKRLTEIGDIALHAELSAIDPESARVIDPRNTRRVVRALEVNEVTGRSFQPVFPRHTSQYVDTIVVGLEMEMGELEERIRLRTDLMFDQGLLLETAALREQGLDQAPTARTATGYREALAVLDGELTEEEARELVSAATRKLVKKQLTWFRRDPRVRWLSARDVSELPTIVREATHNRR